MSSPNALAIESLCPKCNLCCNGALFADVELQPGDAQFVRTDVRFSHEYVTPMAEALFKMGLGEDAKVTEPESVFAFRDHLTFLDRVMPKAHVEMGLKEQAASLARS